MTTPQFETINLDIGAGRAVITLQRPDRLNAYTVQMGEELVAAFRCARDDVSVRAVILTGGGRAFCAGVDLAALQEQRSDTASDRPKLGDEYFVQGFGAELAEYPKPVVVAFNGAAIGVGVTMALPCDIRIASTAAKFGVPFAKLGIVPGLGSTFWLPRLVGGAHARALVLSGDTIDAHEALRIGLVHAVVTPEELLDAAHAWVDKMVACDAATLAAVKCALLRGESCTLGEAMESEHGLNAQLREERIAKVSRT